MVEDNKAILETEWSHFINVDRLEGAQNRFSISPDEDSCQRLVQRLGVVSVDSLVADITVERRPGEVSFHVQGKIDAKVTQNCVITAEPVGDHIQDTFETWFADPDAAVSITKVRHEKLTEKGHGEQPILDERDDPEPVIDGKIDLGELVTQFLSLAVNPYPQAEGVVYEAPENIRDQEESEAANPFAALKDWKDKLGSREN